MAVIDAVRTLDPVEWAPSTMSERIERIVAVHHGHLRRELPRLQSLAEKVAERHGRRHPELGEIREIFHSLKADLDSHMLKEEWSLFPAIRRLESDGPRGELGVRLERAITEREDEQRAVEAALARMEKLANTVMVTSDPSGIYHALIEGLASLKVDLRQHHYEERDLLFADARDAATFLRAEASKKSASGV